MLEKIPGDFSLGALLAGHITEIEAEAPGAGAKALEDILVIGELGEQVCSNFGDSRLSIAEFGDGQMAREAASRLYTVLPHPGSDSVHRQRRH